MDCCARRLLLQRRGFLHRDLLKHQDEREPQPRLFRRTTLHIALKYARWAARLIRDFRLSIFGCVTPFLSVVTAEGTPASAPGARLSFRRVALVFRSLANKCRATLVAGRLLRSPKRILAGGISHENPLQSRCARDSSGITARGAKSRHKSAKTRRALGLHLHSQDAPRRSRQARLPTAGTRKL